MTETSTLNVPSSSASPPASTGAAPGKTPSIPQPEHALQNAWCIWEHRKGASSGGDYGTNMKRLGEFATVEGFWRFFNNIPLPSKLFGSSDEGRAAGDARDIEGISLFKKNIRPEWEDPKNMHGGEFFLRKPGSLDNFWIDLIMGAVGEQISPGEQLCGVRIVDKSTKGKPGYRIEVWFDCNSEQDPQLVEEIRENICAALNANPKLEYRDHRSAVSHGLRGGPPAPHDARGGGGRR